MVKYLTGTSFLIVICLTQNTVRSEVCKAMCRRDGYDTGVFIKKKDSCACGDLKAYKEITDKVISVRPIQHIAPSDEY